MGPLGHRTTTACGHAHAHSQRPTPVGRGIQSSPGFRCRVVSRHAGFSSPPASHQNWAYWRWCVRRRRVLSSPSQRVPVGAPFVEGSGFGSASLGVPFPCHPSGFSGARTASVSSLRLLVKAVVVTAGFDPSMFSGHSLRAGGATDLFASRVPYYTIKKMGRWRSETALIYFRSVDDVARTVARAFDKIGARCKR